MSCGLHDHGPRMADALARSQAEHGRRCRPAVRSQPHRGWEHGSAKSDAIKVDDRYGHGGRAAPGRRLDSGTVDGAPPGRRLDSGTWTARPPGRRLDPAR